MVWPSHPCELYVVTGLPRTVSLIYWSLKLHTRSCWCQCWTDRGEMAQWQCLHCSRLQSPPGLAGGFITSACLHWIEAGQELHSVVIFFFSFFWGIHIWWLAAEHYIPSVPEGLVLYLEAMCCMTPRSKSEWSSSDTVGIPNGILQQKV